MIFTLTLVLAVTAAFASEPKEPDDTIVFHDQAFNRTSLSQETLDWLDWYLTLTEEEQLAISYVPSELREDRDASTQDAYSSEKAGSSTQMANLPAEVLAYAQDLSIGMPASRCTPCWASLPFLPPAFLATPTNSIPTRINPSLAFIMTWTVLWLRSNTSPTGLTLMSPALT